MVPLSPYLSLSHTHTQTKQHSKGNRRNEIKEKLKTQIKDFTRPGKSGKGRKIVSVVFVYLFICLFVCSNFKTLPPNGITLYLYNSYPHHCLSFPFSFILPLFLLFLPRRFFPSLLSPPPILRLITLFVHTLTYSLRTLFHSSLYWYRLYWSSISLLLD